MDTSAFFQPNYAIIKPYKSQGKRKNSKLNPSFVVCSLVQIILIGQGMLYKRDYIPVPHPHTIRCGTTWKTWNKRWVVGGGQGADHWRSPAVIHSTKLKFGVKLNYIRFLYKAMWHFQAGKTAYFSFPWCLYHSFTRRLTMKTNLLDAFLPWESSPFI